MSRTANSETSDADRSWFGARNELFRMIMEGRSFSGRERNCCFLNTGPTGQGRFATVSAVSGLDFPDDGRSIAVTDWDGDGDLDIWTSNRNAPRVRFLKNRVGSTKHFVALRLVGNGSTTSRDAIGARVDVFAHASENKLPEVRHAQTLRAGEGFISQSSKWLHFGLGNATHVARIVVRWPAGDTQTFEGVQVDGRYELRQGVAEPVRINQDRPAIQLAEQEAALPVDSRVARIALMNRVIMPAVVYRQPTGAPRNEPFLDGKPTLINLWASWCLPCLSELEEFNSKQDRLQAAGVRVVALNVDELTKDKGSDSAASDSMKKLGYAGDWGFASEDQMTLLQNLHDQFFFMKRPLPLPCSFLVDAKGRLSVIYRGPVSVDRFLEDAFRANGEYPEAARQAAIFPGTVIDHPRIYAVARHDNLQTRYQVAAFLEESGRLDDALKNFQELSDLDPAWALPIRHLAKLQLNLGQVIAAKELITRALELEPDSGSGQNILGLIKSRQGDTLGAISAWRRSIELDPDSAEPHNNLGTALAGQGSLMAARREFERAVELDDQFAEAYTNLGSTYAAENDYRRAIQEYERAVAVNPRYVDAHNNLGSMHARLGNLTEAIRYYDAVLLLVPGHGQARANRERALQMQETRRRPAARNPAGFP